MTILQSVGSTQTCSCCHDMQRQHAAEIALTQERDLMCFNVEQLTAGIIISSVFFVCIL